MNPDSLASKTLLSLHRDGLIRVVYDNGVEKVYLTPKGKKVLENG